MTEGGVYDTQICLNNYQHGFADVVCFVLVCFVLIITEVNKCTLQMVMKPGFIF